MSENKNIKIVAKNDLVRKDVMDDDLRRLVLSMAVVLKRRFPSDFRRIMAEVEEARAA